MYEYMYLFRYMCMSVCILLNFRELPTYIRKYKKLNNTLYKKLQKIAYSKYLGNRDFYYNLIYFLDLSDLSEAERKLTLPLFTYRLCTPPS